MSTRSKKLNQQELLNSQNSANDALSPKEPYSEFYNAPIENSPFRCIGNEIDGYILVLGKHRLCTPLPTVLDVHNLLEHCNWNIIFNMIASMIEINEEMRTNTLSDSQ